MRTLQLAPWGIVAGFLAGCATPNTAVFVTKTSLGILDADATPASVSIAYDRTEGFFGPAYDSGGVPPVVALFESSGTIFKPNIKQAYATGNAALQLADRSRKPSDEKPLTGGKRMMFFGSSTSIGAKITFMADKPLPTGLTFGFRRKEASAIPLGKGSAATGEEYPSVFASIKSETAMGSRSAAGLELAQVFSTGNAAQILALELRNDFLGRARDTLAVYREAGQKQKDRALEVIRAYHLLGEKKNQAWIDADRLGLFHETADEKGQTLKFLQDPANSAKADAVYVDAVATESVDDPSRVRLLEIHRETLIKLIPSKP